MIDKEYAESIARELRSKRSRDNKQLLEAAADVIERLLDSLDDREGVSSFDGEDGEKYIRLSDARRLIAQELAERKTCKDCRYSEEAGGRRICYFYDELDGIAVDDGDACRYAK